MRWRVAPTAVTVVLVALGAACSSPPPPPPAGPQRVSCGDVLSVALPQGYTCSPYPNPEITSALVEGQRARIVLMASPHLAPGDSATERPPRAGERARPLSINGRTANAMITGSGIWEIELAAWVPDAGNGVDRLAALARYYGEPDEATVVSIIESVRVMRAPPPAPPGPDAAAAPAPAAAGPAAPPTAPPAATPVATAAAPAPVAVPGADPPGWLRHLAGFQITIAAPGDMTVATHDPAQGSSLSLDSRTFEIHVYLSEDGVRSVAASGADTVTSESIVVDGPQGQLHRWRRAAGGKPGRPFELELQSRVAPDVHLSVFTSCQTAAACATAETALRSIRMVRKP